MLPVRQPGHDDAVEVGEDRAKSSPASGGRGGQQRRDLARPRRPGSTRSSSSRSQYVRDPVDHGMPVAAELLWGHMGARHAFRTYLREYGSGDATR